MNTLKNSYTVLGIEPSARVVGSSIVNGTLLLRTRTLHGKTRRYKACYGSEGQFKYFRQVTSSERKRLSKGGKLLCPLEELDWKLQSPHWIAQWRDLTVHTGISQSIIAPTDYSTYVVNGELISRQKLKDILRCQK